MVQEGIDEPTNLKQIQVEKWLQTMKDNHTKTKINLSEKYSEIPETCDRFSGVIKEGAIDLAQTPTGQPHFQRYMPPAQPIEIPALPGGINLGATPSECESQQSQNEIKFDAALFPFVNKTGEVLDRTVIKDRITTLKVMFDDSATLRQQRGFLNAQGKSVLIPADSPIKLDLVEQYNLNKKVQE